MRGGSLRHSRFVIASKAKQSRLGDCGLGLAWIASLSLAMTTDAPLLPLAGRRCRCSRQMRGRRVSASRHCPTGLMVDSPDAAAAPRRPPGRERRRPRGSLLFPKFCRRQWRAFARRLRRSKTIDGGKTSEGHASMRPTAWCVTEVGEAGAVEKVRRRSRSGNCAVHNLSP